MSFKKKSCFIIGQDYAKEGEQISVQNYTVKNIEKLIYEGVVYFYVGGATEYEIDTGETLIKLREKHPQIKVLLILLEDFIKDTADWGNRIRERLQFINEVADDIFYTNEYYNAVNINMRNRYLVANSSYCMFYYKERDKIAEKTIENADKNGLRIIDIHEKMEYDRSVR